MLHVATASGGGGSWLAGRIMVREKVKPGDDLCFVFTDTLYEDADAYRFLIQSTLHTLGRSVNWLPAAEDFPDYRVDPDLPLDCYHGNPAWRDFLRQLRGRTHEVLPELVWLVEGRDIWEVCRDERFLVNSSVDPCSKVLKREPFDEWLRETCDPDDTVIYYGIGGGEAHRYDDGDGHGIKHRLAMGGWDAQAPLIGRVEGDLHPSLYMQNAGILPPRLYKWAGHNNCQGGCGKGGIKYRRTQLANMPDRYAYDALMERKFGVFLERTVTFLEDRRGGQRKPMTLIELAQREGLDADELERLDEEARALVGDSGNGCACFL